VNKLYRIDEKDNVAVALEPLEKGYTEQGITLLDDIPFGHKVLLEDMNSGGQIIKYANPIGSLTCDVRAGSHIHEHNLKTNLSDSLSYDFGGDNAYSPQKSDLSFEGYLRSDGRAGIRNEIWIIPTVGCVNNTVRMLEKAADSITDGSIDGVYAFTHPYGCSQLGDDQENTRRVLAGLIEHPNAGGVLVVSLGCENSNIGELKKYLGDYDGKRVKFLVTQDCIDELKEGKRLIKEIFDYIKNDKRQTLPISKLTVGLKCGASDAFSGITANALCGRATDILTDGGAAVLLTEVPEMFGAEHLLMQRTQDRAVFGKTVEMINGFKEYFESHNQVCYENPSPGNHAGGITTLEEKSLGCVQKGGNAVVTDVLDYAQRARKSGLSLLWGPGNDIVSTTNLVCAGANLILFTTGRGTPLGTPVPTLKIASNTPLSVSKPSWIDFNAGTLLDGGDTASVTEALIAAIIEAANGKRLKNETNGYREIAIFKDGVTM
jgi:altronate hydrolase